MNQESYRLDQTIENQYNLRSSRMGNRMTVPTFPFLAFLVPGCNRQAKESRKRPGEIILWDLHLKDLPLSSSRLFCIRFLFMRNQRAGYSQWKTRNQDINKPSMDNELRIQPDITLWNRHLDVLRYAVSRVNWLSISCGSTFQWIITDPQL